MQNFQKKAFQLLFYVSVLSVTFLIFELFFDFEKRFEYFFHFSILLLIIFFYFLFILTKKYSEYFFFNNNFYFDWYVYF